MDCMIETCQRLLDAAIALLEARSNQMVTPAEWDALRDAVVACRGAVSIAEDLDD